MSYGATVRLLPDTAVPQLNTQADSYYNIPSHCCPDIPLVPFRLATGIGVVGTHTWGLLDSFSVERNESHQAAMRWSYERRKDGYEDCSFVGVRSEAEYPGRVPASRRKWRSRWVVYRPRHLPSAIL